MPNASSPATCAVRADRSTTPHFTYCTTWGGPYKLLGKIKRGQGPLALQAFTPGALPPR